MANRSRFHSSWPHHRRIVHGRHYRRFTERRRNSALDCFFLTFGHLEVDLEADKHFQWNIDDFNIKAVDKRIAICLFGGA